MRTVKGVYLDLKDSDYIVEYNKITMYFSSQFYQNKFNNEIKEFIKTETLKLKNKYNIKADLTPYLILSLYTKIEKRGFRVLYKNRELRYNEIIVITNIL